MRKIFVVANQKGGIGKTTTAIAMTSILNRFGYKTLLIDADPSGYATDTFKAKVEGEATLYDVILDNSEPAPLEEAIQKTDAGYIVAYDPLLRKTDSMCAGDANAVFRLSDAINDAMERGALDDFDFIVMDTPPEIGMLLNNCLVAAQEVIVPITADRYGVRGLSELYSTITAVRKRPNKDLNIYGLLIVMLDERLRLFKETKKAILEYSEKMGTRVLKTAIRKSVVAQEAQTARKTLLEYSPSCSTELDYEDFVELIIKESEDK